MKAFATTALIALFALTGCAEENPSTETNTAQSEGASSQGYQCKGVDEGTACDDDNACTENDACQMDGGYKVCAGTPINVDDWNPCTVDSCVDGAVVNANDEGAACTPGANACGATEGFCSLGVCLGSGAPKCDDGIPCTEDGCDSFGDCINVLKSDACLIGSTCFMAGDHQAGGGCGMCDPSKEKFVFVADSAICDDGSSCTSTSCNLEWGNCETTAADCNDGNPCTADNCYDDVGCVSTALDGDACDDGDACTMADACDKGGCAGTAAVCDDGQPCTVDSCDPALGCVAGTDDCDDGSPCTYDSCHKQKGCINNPEPEGFPCSDGSLCTSNDMCTQGLCVGQGFNCDDGKLCTKDFCEEATGSCINEAIADGDACDDGTVCTTGDTCMEGNCVGATAMDCDDDSACTFDYCDPAQGCVNAPLPDGSICSDGDMCTGPCPFRERYKVLDPFLDPNTSTLFTMFFFPELGQYEYVFFEATDALTFTIDHEGTARLSGPIKHGQGLPEADANKNWYVDCGFWARGNAPGTGGPFVQEAFQSQFTDQWTYFDLIEGDCVVATTDGSNVIRFTEKPSPGVFPTQIGPGANSFTADFGLSNWLNYTYKRNGVLHQVCKQMNPDGSFKNELGPCNTDLYAKLNQVAPCPDGDGSGDQCIGGSCVAGPAIIGCQ